MNIEGSVLDNGDTIYNAIEMLHYTTMYSFTDARHQSDNQTMTITTTTTPDVVGTTEEGLIVRVIAPFVYRTLVPILYGLVSVLGIAGNSLVIYVILARDRMRTVTNLLLLNLAFADLSFVLVIPPVTAYVMKSPTLGWPLGDAECRLMHYLVNVTAYVTVYTLVLISVIRYMTIVHSVRTVAIRTTANVVRMIVAIWVVMLAVNSPVLVSYGARPIPMEEEEGGGGRGTATVEEDGNGTSRAGEGGGGVWDGFGYNGTAEVVTECDTNERQALFVTFFMFGYVVPLIAIACLSMGILRHITRHKAPTAINRDGSSVSAAATGVVSRSADKKRKAGRMLILITVLFAILWMPVHIHLLLSSFELVPDNTLYDAVSPLWNCLAYFNSCVNPIIYNRTSAEFRNAFRDVAHCRGAGGQHRHSDDSKNKSGRIEAKQAAHGNGKSLTQYPHGNETTCATFVPASDKTAIKLINLSENKSEGADGGNGYIGIPHVTASVSAAQLV